MDGTVTVLYGTTGTLLATLRPHSKYVVRVAWFPRGLNRDHASRSAATSTTATNPTTDDSSSPHQDAAVSAAEQMSLMLASASTDETVALLSLDLQMPSPAAEVLALGTDPGSGPASGGCGAGGCDSGGVWGFIHDHQFSTSDMGAGAGRARLRSLRQVGPSAQRGRKGSSCGNFLGLCMRAYLSVCVLRCDAD